MYVTSVGLESGWTDGWTRGWMDAGNTIFLSPYV